jgi:hypothetical protein
MATYMLKRTATVTAAHLVQDDIVWAGVKRRHLQALQQWQLRQQAPRLLLQQPAAAAAILVGPQQQRGQLKQGVDLQGQEGMQ